MIEPLVDNIVQSIVLPIVVEVVEILDNVLYDVDGGALQFVGGAYIETVD